VENRKRYLMLALCFLLLFSSVACICGQCSNPLAQRQSDNAPIVKGADLGQVVMARGIGDGNRPISPTNSFSSSEDVIYCVVEAKRIDEGTSFYARWSYEGEPFEDTPVITADRQYTDTYIEFHIEPKRLGVLKTGKYSVKIYVNGNPVKTVEFQVN